MNDGFAVAIFGPEKLGKTDLWRQWTGSEAKDTPEARVGRWKDGPPVVTLLDTPGNPSLRKNVFSGMVQADVGLLMLPAWPRGLAESSLIWGGDAHSLVLAAHAFGLSPILVAVSGSDRPHEAERSLRLHELFSCVQSCFQSVGIRNAPIRMLWADDPTWVETLRSIPSPRMSIDGPLRVILQDAFASGPTGCIAIGRVLTGVVKLGDSVVTSPGGKLGTVQSLERYREPLSQAVVGDNIGLALDGIKPADLRRGVVLIPPEVQPVPVIHEFVAKLLILDLPGGRGKGNMSARSIQPGYSPLVDIGTAHASCRILEILRRVVPVPSTGTGGGAEVEGSEKVAEEDLSRPIKALRPGDACVVRLRPERPLHVEPFAKVPALGRLLLRDLGTIIAIGIVDQVHTKNQK